MASKVAVFRRAVDAVVSEKVLTTANSRLDCVHREGRVFLSAPDADIVEDLSEIVSLISYRYDYSKQNFQLASV